MSDPTRTEWIIGKTEAVAPHGMVSADQAVATDAGLAVLREGGNAVDAAVTAAFVMAVAEPALNGIGGVAAMVIALPDGRTTVIDGSGLAPREAREDMFEIASGGDVKGMYGWPAAVGDENNTGYRSAGVPGMVAAMSLALERYGTIDLARAVRPAIELARAGLDVDIHLTNTLASYADRLWRFADSKRLFFKEGGLPLHPPTALEGGGDKLVQPGLARSLEAIATEGVAGFYRGALAHAIVDEVRRGGGLLSLEDLASYEARELAPLRIRYRDHDVATLPDVGGGITVAQALGILDGFDFGSLDRSSAAYLHLIAEAQRLAFLDRFQHLADPRYSDAFGRVASREHAAELRARIDPARVAPAPAAAMSRDVPHTTHLCAVDASRIVVSLTSTLGGAFGSAAVLGDTGILLANVMTWFDPRPGRLNSVAGGKRILWAPSPTVATRGGTPRLAVGASGGRRLISAVLQTVVNVIDHGDGPQDAANGWRIHDEGSGTLIETRVPAATRAELERMGHRVVPTDETFASPAFGRLNAILIDERGVRGGVTRMRPSVAAGY